MKFKIDNIKIQNIVGAAIKEYVRKRGYSNVKVKPLNKSSFHFNVTGDANAGAKALQDIAEEASRRFQEIKLEIKPKK